MFGLKRLSGGMQVGSLLPPRALCYTLEVSFFHAASDVTVVTPTGAPGMQSGQKHT